MLKRLAIYAKKAPSYFYGKHRQRQAAKHIRKTLSDCEPSKAIAASGIRDISLICVATAGKRPDPAFYEYYRRMGVRRFIVLTEADELHSADEPSNNDQSPDVITLPVNKVADVHIHASAIINDFLKDRWCIVCGPDDYLVFPMMETRTLADFCDFIDSERRRHIYTVEIDLYRDKYEDISGVSPSDREALSKPGQGTWYFDLNGYQQHHNEVLQTTEFLGGYTDRSTEISGVPRNMNRARIGLVRSNGDFDFRKGARFFLRAAQNSANAPWHLSPTACFLTPGQYIRLCERWTRLPMSIRERLSETLIHENSARLGTDWGKQFEGSDLLNRGQWF